MFTFGEMGKGLKQEEEAYIMDLTFTNRIWPYRAELASGCKAERKLHGGGGWVLRDYVIFQEQR